MKLTINTIRFAGYCPSRCSSIFRKGQTAPLERFRMASSAIAAAQPRGLSLLHIGTSFFSREELAAVGLRPRAVELLFDDGLLVVQPFIFREKKFQGSRNHVIG